MKKTLSVLLCLFLVISLALPAHAASKTVLILDYLGGNYLGSAADGRPEGNGTLSWGNCSYSGNFKNGYPSGYGKFTYTNGDTHVSSNWSWGTGSDWTWVDRKGATMQYEGMADNNYACGYGTLEFDAGGSFSGEFVDGEPDGWGIYTYRNPQSKKSAQKEGDDWAVVYGQYKYEHSYTGLTLNGKWQGFGVGIKKSGYAYCGEIVNYKRDGYGELYTAKDKLETKGIWRSGGIKQRY